MYFVTTRFNSLSFHWTKGHPGNPYNILADMHAVNARNSCSNLIRVTQGKYVKVNSLQERHLIKLYLQRKSIPVYLNAMEFTEDTKSDLTSLKEVLKYFTEMDIKIALNEISYAISEDVYYQSIVRVREYIETCSLFNNIVNLLLNVKCNRNLIRLYCNLCLDQYYNAIKQIIIDLQLQKEIKEEVK